MKIVSIPGDVVYTICYGYPENRIMKRVGIIFNYFFMKNIFIASVIFSMTCFTTLFAQTSEKSNLSDEYLNGNIAITNITARLVNESFYILELKVTDFNKSEFLPVGFGLRELSFSDNGKGNDLKANDGIYTATSVSKFLNGRPKILEKKVAIIGFSFKYDKQLNVGPDVFKISCKLTKCGCPCSIDGMSCNACIYFGWACWRINECEVALDF